MGIGSIVKVIEHDVTLDELFPGVDVSKESVDVVTMSYSYSMIPNKRAAVNNITKLLKRGGYLCIADFFLKGNYDDCLSPLFRRLRAAESMFHKNWFAMDHVFLLEEKQLQGYDDYETVWDQRFRGAVPFLPFLNPFHGVYIMKKK